MHIFQKTLVLSFLISGLNSVSMAQGLPQDVKTKYPGGVYTSTKEIRLGRASCVPCKNDEGDPHQFQEAIPYRLNPKTATIVCKRDPEKTKNDDNPCVFNPFKVSIDNNGMVGTIDYNNRSEAVIIQLRGEILDDQSKTE